MLRDALVEQAKMRAEQTDMRIVQTRLDESQHKLEESQAKMEETQAKMAATQARHGADLAEIKDLLKAMYPLLISAHARAEEQSKRIDDHARILTSLIPQKLAAVGER